MDYIICANSLGTVSLELLVLGRVGTFLKPVFLKVPARAACMSIPL
jgi:hypothetical protein